MAVEFDNPCARCTTGMGCCRALWGLRLSEAEFQQHFADHRKKLDVSHQGPIRRISVKKRGTCPHLEKGCTVYAERPIECSLYPHTIGKVWILGKRALITYHTHRSECPSCEELKLPDAEAADMVAQFAKNTFGDGYRIKVWPETYLFHILVNGHRIFFWKLWHVPHRIKHDVLKRGRQYAQSRRKDQ